MRSSFSPQPTLTYTRDVSAALKTLGVIGPGQVVRVGN